METIDITHSGSLFLFSRASDDVIGITSCIDPLKTLNTQNIAQNGPTSTRLTLEIACCRTHSTYIESQMFDSILKTMKFTGLHLVHTLPLVAIVACSYCSSGSCNLDMKEIFVRLCLYYHDTLQYIYIFISNKVCNSDTKLYCPSVQLLCSTILRPF